MIAIVATCGVLILAALGVLCFTVYKIGAENFEFTAAVLNFVSISVKVVSKGRRSTLFRVPTKTA